MSAARVVVLGASGGVGARVVRSVSAVPGVEVLGASRSGRGAGGERLERIDVRDPATLALAVREGDLVVNCVGPFHYDPAPLVASCVAAGAHYCDLADDPAFAERARRAARGGDAAARGVFVCTGASTVPGLVGVLASALAASPRAPEIARVSVYLSVGSANPVSAGLLASLLAPLGRALPGAARCFGSLRALRTSAGRTLRFGSYPAAFEHGALILGARSVPVHFAFGFDRAALTALLRALAPLLARIPPLAFARLAPALLPFARVAQLFGTPLGVLVVVAEGGGGEEIARLELAARAHGLDVPAAPPAFIAARLARGEQLRAGSAELHELVPLADVLSWVRSRPELSLGASGSVAL